MLETSLPQEAARLCAERYRHGGFPFHAKKRLAGYRLEATDIDWADGEGALVRGPIAALLLLITGRPVALPRLSGDGVPRLRQQLEVTS